MFARLRQAEDRALAEPLARHLPPALAGRLMDGLCDGMAMPDAGDAQARDLLLALARQGLLRFHSAPTSGAVTLAPASSYFDWPDDAVPADAAAWKLSRFASIHQDGDALQLRNPRALCYLLLNSEAALALVFRLNQPVARSAIRFDKALADEQDTIFRMLLAARAIVPCDADHVCSEDADPVARQWDAHDLLFHSRSRFGRSERPIGGTFRFQGVLAPQPSVKAHDWHTHQVPLPAPDLYRLAAQDMPLTAALEARVSNRNHSPLPLALEQLGHFLYRTVRNRYAYASDYGEFVSRPYPCGGANYEQEFYLTINACADLARGFYYYDPQRHCLCLVSAPCAEMEALLDDAFLASARQCRPQILITIASRFNRFNWKYSGMSYAAQLKNIGAIYQTMYLVATAMRIAACGLGTGNADRFSRLTGLAYLEEGSLGEFMLGRPL